MSGELFAARLGDISFCMAHGAGMVIAIPKNGFVLVNGRFAAKGADMIICPTGPLDYITTGAGTVKINGQPAARVASKTLHKGLVLGMSPNVLYGGPNGGATLGNPDAAKAMCEAAAAGRANGGLQQSYGDNCGCECARMLLNQLNGTNTSESDYLACQEAAGNARDGDPDSKGVKGRGVTDPGDTKNQLQNVPPCASPNGPGYGYDSTQMPQNTPGAGGAGSDMNPDMQQAVANGQGVIANTTISAVSDGPYQTGSGNHAVIVSGVTYDGEGNPQSVTVVDTGVGNCAKTISMDRFGPSMGTPGSKSAVVTNAPVY